MLPASANMPRSHRLPPPETHAGQRPQVGTNWATTWSPTASDRTPGPTASTTPAPSCPPISGSLPIGMSPVAAWSSEWQSPAATNRTSTSCSRGSSRSTSITCHFPGCSSNAAARVLMARLLGVGSGVADRELLDAVEPARAQPHRVARAGDGGHVVGDGVEDEVDLEPGQVGADAVVRPATAEPQVRVRVAHDVEALGLGEDLVVEVGRA